jgi:hypothetical protein
MTRCLPTHPVARFGTLRDHTQHRARKKPLQIFRRGAKARISESSVECGVDCGLRPQFTPRPETAPIMLMRASTEQERYKRQLESRLGGGPMD